MKQVLIGGCAPYFMSRCLHPVITGTTGIMLVINITTTGTCTCLEILFDGWSPENRDIVKFIIRRYLVKWQVFSSSIDGECVKTII